MDALTGIRAVTALWVVAYHFALSPLAALHLGRLLPPVQIGYLGVDLFFLLSGFIITHVHRRDAASLAPNVALRFYGLRLARMYPVHLLMLLVLVPVVAGGRLLGFAPHHPEDFRAADFVFDLLLIQSWGVSDDIHWNFPAWSVSCEWFVYLLFPVFALWLNRIASARRAVLWLAAETAAFALAYVLVFHFDLDLKFGAGGFSRSALTRVCFEFAAGALCCRLTELADLGSWPWTALVLAAGAIAAALSATPARDIAVVCACAVTIVAARYRSTLIARILALPVLVYLGEISYSLYMVHAPIRMTLGKFAERVIAGTGPGLVGYLIGVAFFLVTVLAAAIIHHSVEAPARRWLRYRFIEPQSRASSPSFGRSRAVATSSRSAGSTP